MSQSALITKPKAPIFIHDFPARLHEDLEFRSEIQELMHDILRKCKGTSRLEHVKALARVIPASGFNFGHLIPFFFPRYPVDKPLDLRTRPFMYAMTCLSAGSTTTLMAGRQVGKCVTGDTTLSSSRGDLTLRQLFDMAV